MRKFEVVKKDHLKYDCRVEDIKLPKRATISSVGYDCYSPIDATILPNEIKLIFLNVKAYFNSDEGLFLATTSGMGKKGIVLAQGIGVIESDYAGNISNDGNLGFLLHNVGQTPYEIHSGDKIGQCWFSKFLTVDDEVPPTQIREGGFGSTVK